jgi:hypothetical protein
MNENDFDTQDDLSALEIYLSSDTETFADEDGLVWKEVLREGEWTVRPGANQSPVKKPLKVVVGYSEDPSTEIGFADLIDAFNEGAIDHVTIPTSHEDKPEQNTGFVRALEVRQAEDGTYKLFAGMEFTEPDIKEKALRGTIANTSVGVIFDYIKKSTGKVYKMALGHIALTNKPWINGMKPFGVNASEDLDIEEIASVIIEEGVELPVPISEKLTIDETGEENLAEDYDKEEDDEDESEESKSARFLDKLLMAVKEGNPDAILELLREFDGNWPVDWDDSIDDMTYEGREEEPEMLRMIVKSIRGANQELDLEFFTKLIADVKKFFSAKEQMMNSAESLGAVEWLPKEWQDVDSAKEGKKSVSLDASDENNEVKQGGIMSEETSVGQEDTDRLEDEEVAADDANLSEPTADYEAELEATNTKLSEQDAKIRDLERELHKKSVAEKVSDLKEVGFSEFPGLLKTIEELYLADEGSSVATLSLSEEGGETAEIELTVSDIVTRIVEAMPKSDDGSLKFSEQVSEFNDHSRRDSSSEDYDPAERAAAIAEQLGRPFPTEEGGN